METTSVGRTTEHRARVGDHGGLVTLRMSEANTGGHRVPRQIPEVVCQRKFLVRSHRPIA